MKYIIKFFFAICAAFALSSCATTTMLGNSYSPKSIDAPIDVFVTKKPAKDYYEIALIKCEDITNKATINRIKKKARQLGADAIIVTGAASSSGYVNSTGYYSASDSGFSAIAIKYK